MAASIMAVYLVRITLQGICKPSQLNPKLIDARYNKEYTITADELQ